MSHQLEVDIARPPQQVFELLVAGETTVLPHVRRVERRPAGRLAVDSVEVMHFPWFLKATWQVEALDPEHRYCRLAVVKAPLGATGLIAWWINEDPVGAQMLVVVDVPILAGRLQKVTDAELRQFAARVEAATPV